MTTRIDSPNTPADVELRTCLDARPPRDFVMVAGAGSGKTTSLVKALAYLEEQQGLAIRGRGQQIACITYTEVAVAEIWGDVHNSPLFHVSTIHSFLWTVVRPFQADLRCWVETRINEKIADAEQRLAKPRTQERTKVKLREDIERLRATLAQVSGVMKFSYGTGSNYAKGILGHDDVLRVGPALIQQYPLMRSLIARRFPYIFVDESQDTDPNLIEALKSVAAIPDAGFCVGFFGDPMQKIYTAGAGAIRVDEGWQQITKRENFRCPTAVLRVINRIRAEDDGLEQVAGTRIGEAGPVPTPEGSARFFIAANTADRTATLNEVRQRLAHAGNDPLWVSGDADLRLLVLVHRVAARRLRFPDLYAALNDNGAPALKDGLLEGTAWVLRPFMTYLLPLLVAARQHDDFEVMNILRLHCPLLAKERLPKQNVADVLARLGTGVARLLEMFDDGGTSTIRDVLAFVLESDIADLDERFGKFLGGTVAEDDPEYAALSAFVATPALQLWGYRSYIEDESPFSTQQGIKGAQFQRVLVVLDDEESDYNLFSYGKYLGVDPLSAQDNENVAAGKDSVIDRTRRLFYVCCSRAVRDLVVVLFAANIEAAREAVLRKGFFEPGDIHMIGR